MAKGFEELDEWVAGLENLAGGLSDGRVFFQAHEERYLSVARQVGGQALLALVPDGVDANEWRERVAEFEELVFSRQAGSGMEIIYAGRSEEDKTGGRQVKITYDDVLEWVKAGVENGGKDKTAVEINRGRANEQIAYDVKTAIDQYRLGLATDKDYSAITERLERWVESRVISGDFADLLVVVLEAWVSAVGVLMEKDLADWADDEIRRAF